MNEVIEKTFKKYTTLENETIFKIVSENIQTIRFSNKFISFKKHKTSFFKWTTIAWIILFLLFSVPFWTFFIPLFIYLIYSLIHFIDISMITRSMNKISNILYEEYSLDVSLDDLFVYSFVVLENWEIWNDYE